MIRGVNSYHLDLNCKSGPNVWPRRLSRFDHESLISVESDEQVSKCDEKRRIAEECMQDISATQREDCVSENSFWEI